MGAPVTHHSPSGDSASRWVLAGLLAWLWLPPVALAGDSGALLLRGHFPVACSISVEATQSATTLDLSQNAFDVPVASVTETCNSGSGYTVELSSRENGSLSGTHDAVSYRLAYDRAGADLSGSRAAPVVLTDAAGPTGPAGTTRNVTISYSAAAALHGGSYEDVLTFTVAAK